MPNYVIIDATGKVIATHTWGGIVKSDQPCPIDYPPQGYALELDKDGIDVIVDEMVKRRVVEVAVNTKTDEMELKVGGVIVGKVENGELKGEITQRPKS